MTSSDPGSMRRITWRSWMLPPLLACGSGADVAGPGGEAATLKVVTETNGPSPDSNGYTLTLDGSGAHALGANDTLLLQGVSPGAHTVALGGVSENCQVDGGGTRTVELEAGQTLRLDFRVACDLPVTAIEVIVSTIGLGPDPDGYLVRIDAAAGEPVSSSDTVRFENVSPGEHLIDLDGLADNCSVEGPNPLSLSVAPGATALADFEVRCSIPGRITFYGFVDAAREDQGDIFVVNNDGTGLQRLTNDEPTDQYPAFSPDGRRIAFWTAWPATGGLFVMNQDGTQRTRVFTEPLGEGFEAVPVWSPDGTRLAFAVPAKLVDHEVEEVHAYVVGVDGSDVTLLSRHAGTPSWSPDGTRLALAINSPTNPANTDVYTVSPDGTDEVRLTDAPGVDEHPLWSPDRTAIAFVSDRDAERTIYLMAPDGSNLRRLAHLGEGSYPLGWSPDGKKMLFFRRPGPGTQGDMFVIQADGTDETNVTQQPLHGYDGSWSRDGRAIAFSAPVRDDDGVHQEIWVVNPDGSGKTPITSLRDFGTGSPSWGP